MSQTFHRWLVQDYHFVTCFLRFVSALLSRSERTEQPLLVQGIDFLLRTAWSCDVEEILAAMTPCMRLYNYLFSGHLNDFKIQ